MIDCETRMLLMEAIGNPHLYVRGANRTKLRLAFEFLLSILCSDLFDVEYVNRVTFRKKLNDIDESQLDAKNVLVVQYLKMALRECDPLFSKSYTDHEDDIRLFLQNHLDHLLRVLS